MTEAEPGVMLPQAQECQGLPATPEAGRGTEWFLYQSLREESVLQTP